MDSTELQPAQMNRRPVSLTGYIRELDGLRAIAVACVLIWHYLPADNSVRELTTWGWIGVRLFFVLSGFLITRILLNCRDLIETRKLSLGRGLGTFFVRRMLRISPIYYAFLLALLVVQPKLWPHSWAYALYLQNFLIASFDTIGLVPSAGHLWTLAVEEQFYLLWPWLILLMPTRGIVMTTLLITLSGPIWRAILLASGLSPVGTMVMMPANFDSLGMGALLAVGFWSSGVSQSALQRWANRAAVVGFPSFGLYLALYLMGYHRLDSGLVQNAMFVAADFSGALVYTWLIHLIIVGPPRTVSIFLSSAALVYIGRISYGIYLFHVPVPGLYERIFFKLGIAPLPVLVQFTLSSITTIGIAAVSWQLFEKPINSLKSRFEYAPVGSPSAHERDVDVVT